MKKTLKYALLDSLGTASYIVFIILLLNLLRNIFMGKESILIPITMLTLFVFSAALTGSLVLGRSILWYIDGKKREAINLFIYTLGILFIIIVLIFLIALLIV